MLSLLGACGGGGGKSGPTPTPTPGGPSTPTPTPVPTPPPDPFTIAAAVPDGGPPGVAFGTGRFLVAYSDVGGRSAPDLYGLRLTDEGVIIDREPLLLSQVGDDPFLDPADAFYSSSAIAFDGTRFGVFFFGGGTVSGVEGLPGEVLDFVPVTPSGDVLGPATQLAARETFSMVATSIAPPVAAAGASGRFVDLFQNLQLTGGPPSVFGGTLISVLGSFVSVVDGAVQTAGVGDITPDVPPPVGEIVASASAPGVATSGTTTLGAWVETRSPVAMPSPTIALRGALMVPDGDPELLSFSSVEPGSQGAAVATDGTDFLLVWTSATAEGPMTLTEVRAVRYRPGTGVLDPDGGFLVAAGPGAKNLGGVAFGDGVYLVVWTENDDSVWACGVLPDGTVQGAFAIGGGPGNEASVAFGRERFLVVFNRDAGDSTVDVMGTFVAAAR
jgi:hypothetical protein